MEPLFDLEHQEWNGTDDSSSAERNWTGRDGVRRNYWKKETRTERFKKSRNVPVGGVILSFTPSKVFDFYIISLSISCRETHKQSISLSKQKHGYLFHTWSDNVFWVTLKIKHYHLCMEGHSLKITLIIPLNNFDVMESVQTFPQSFQLSDCFQLHLDPDHLSSHVQP